MIKTRIHILQGVVSENCTELHNEEVFIFVTKISLIIISKTILWRNRGVAHKARIARWDMHTNFQL